MTTNYTDAIDSMFSLFKTEWDVFSLSLLGYAPDIRWPGVEEPEKPDCGKYFSRISQQTVNESQSTLADDSSIQRYTCDGLLFVQIFAPRSDSQSMENMRALAMSTKNVFRKHTDSGNIWFRNSRIEELPPEENFYNFNVVAEYQYDEKG